MEDQFFSSIARAIAFFDIFDYPLTDRELFEYAYQLPTKPRLTFASFVLQMRECTDTRIGCTQGMWHLRGRESIVLLRTERSVHLEKKLDNLTKAVKLFSGIPFIRSVFVCNTLAFNAADSDSDIDVLIIARFGRMWIARLWTTIILSLYRLRRTKKKIADRICLSFYLADRTLNLSKFRIAPDDIYLSYWLRTLIPVYDPDSLGESMTRANQDLLAPFFDRARHYTPAFVSPQKYVNKNFIARFFEMVLSGSFGSTVEKFARSFQRRKIMHNSKSLVHAKDTRVVVNDSMFKFHENDRRALYRDLWKKRVKEMGIPNYSN